ncbi:hypothetical protein WDU94_003072 [Cyamophila willieti]
MTNVYTLKEHQYNGNWHQRSPREIKKEKRIVARPPQMNVDLCPNLVPAERGLKYPITNLHRIRREDIVAKKNRVGAYEWTEERRRRRTELMKERWKKVKEEGRTYSMWSERKRQHHSEKIKATWKRLKAEGRTRGKYKMKNKTRPMSEERKKIQKAIMRKYWDKIKQEGNNTERDRKISEKVRITWSRTKPEIRLDRKRKISNGLKRYWNKQWEEGNFKRIYQLNDKMQAHWKKLKEKGITTRERKISDSLKKYWSTLIENHGKNNNRSEKMRRMLDKFWNTKSGYSKRQVNSHLFKIFWAREKLDLIKRGFTARNFQEFMKQFWRKRYPKHGGPDRREEFGKKMKNHWEIHSRAEQTENEAKLKNLLILLRELLKKRKEEEDRNSKHNTSQPDDEDIKVGTLKRSLNKDKGALKSYSILIKGQKS